MNAHQIEIMFVWNGFNSMKEKKNNRKSGTFECEKWGFYIDDSFARSTSTDASFLTHLQ